MQLTPEQKVAVNAGGDSLLVSAAAGSGKTSVLTSRVIRLLTNEQNKITPDSLVVLTFTEAAAAEMRDRITRALKDAVRENPDSTFYRRQLMLLPTARISTIHSACLSIIRDNFQLCDVDAAFTIAEENKLEIMKNAELEDFVESLYDLAQTDKSVLQVIEYFTRGRDDGALSRAIVSASEFLTSQPYAREFIDSACAQNADADALSVMAHIKTITSDILCRYNSLTDRAFEVPKLCDFYAKERDFVALLHKFINDLQWDKAYEHVAGYKFASHPRRTKNDSVDMWDTLKDERTKLKKRITDLQDDFLFCDFSTLCTDRVEELGIIRNFLNICLDFCQRFADKRKKMRIMSFDDIEKYALRLLIDGFEDGKPVKTKLATELSSQISEIIVDECQDCNRTQNLIFTALSKNGTNIFMVGDVKQSIYRFRGAEPFVFLEKQNTSQPITEAATIDTPSRVNLSRNFRSNAKILSFVNSVFAPIMTPKTGDIDYSDSHLLYPNTDAPESESNIELSLVVSGSAQDELTDKLSMLEAEAKSVADKIKHLLENGTVYNGKDKVYRKITPSDIAVLMRAPKSNGAVFENAFKAAGIPYINNNPAENYLDSPEVRQTLAYLQVIDNPYNDIPLVTLMYSDYFGFTAKELASIRANSKGSLFFDAVRKYADTDPKTNAFLQKLDYLRALSLTTDVYGIISAVYETSGILLRLSSKDGGDAVKANLQLLREYAQGFESDRYRGLFAFINYISKLAEKSDSIPAARLKKSGDCVSILSIHRSKGLEYPVVFVCCCANEIKRVGYDEIKLCPELGAGGYVRDSVRHRDFSSPYRNLLCDFEHRADLCEYMRLLYVALTRPINHLYLSASTSVSELEKIMRSVYFADKMPNAYDIAEKPSFLKWMMFSLIRTKSANNLCAFAGVPTDLCIGDTIADIKLVPVSQLEQEPEQKESAFHTFDIDKEEIKENITREYEHHIDTTLPLKLSVSEIKNMSTDPNLSKAPVEKKRPYFKTPKFLQKARGTDVGNATHHFLQFCDFSKVCDMPSLMLEKKRLVDYEFITEKESELVDFEKVLEFLTSDLMKTLTDGSECIKEQRFLFTLPANELVGAASDSRIIIQGIVDCLYIKDGKAVIVDYKTDTVPDIETLASRYRTQLEMYEKAVMHIKGIPTQAKYIYSFHLGRFIEV